MTTASQSKLSPEYRCKLCTCKCENTKQRQHEITWHNVNTYSSYS